MKDSAPYTPGSGITRRTAVKLTAVGLVGAAVGVGATASATRLGRSAPARYRSFTEAEASLLIEICEQIIPRDDTPGATDAGVIHYIDRQLAGAFAAHRPTYQRGLQAFGRTCLQVYRTPFQGLAAEKKIDALRLVEAGKAPAEFWDAASQRTFFGLVVSHTIQGFYGSPRHGGNRGYASYRMLNLDYPQVLGRNRVTGTKA